MRKLDDRIEACQASRSDLEEVERDPESIVSLLMRPCYKFSKLAKQNFFDDVHFSLMFLIFTRRGRRFLEQKAEEATDKMFYLQIV
jgi:hypothetical protein